MGRIRVFFLASSVAPRKIERGPGRPRTGIGPAISMRLYPEVEAALYAWIERHPEPRPSRSETLRRLVEKGLEGEES